MTADPLKRPKLNCGKLRQEGVDVVTIWRQVRHDAVEVRLPLFGALDSGEHSRPRENAVFDGVSRHRGLTLRRLRSGARSRVGAHGRERPGQLELRAVVAPAGQRWFRVFWFPAVRHHDDPPPWSGSGKPCRLVRACQTIWLGARAHMFLGSLLEPSETDVEGLGNDRN